jgi:hypothetical protein
MYTTSIPLNVNEKLIKKGNLADEKIAGSMELRAGSHIQKLLIFVNLINGAINDPTNESIASTATRKSPYSASEYLATEISPTRLTRLTRFIFTNPTLLKIRKLAKKFEIVPIMIID